MFFGLFKPKPKRRTSRKTSGNKRRTSRTPFKGTVRKGYLKYRGVTAKTARGRFAGRVQLKRSALVEFPTADQLISLLRKYGIPKDATQRAFGHMMKDPKNKPRKTTRRAARKTSRRRSTKRRTTRRRTTKRRRTSRRRLRRNAAKRTIRRDYISVPTTLDGEPIPFSATIAEVPEALVGIVGARRAIAISIAGEKTALVTAPDALSGSKPWVTTKEFRKAFGQLLKGSVLGDTAPQKGIPNTYGPRTMKLGHVPGWQPGDPIPSAAAGDDLRGSVVPGIVPGHLILFHKPSGQIVWQAWDDEDRQPKKPILIKFGAGTAHFDFYKALQGARTGKGASRSKEPVGALDRNIPPMAMLQAFDYLLAPAQRKAAYGKFVIYEPK
jgi:hypothetical protein